MTTFAVERSSMRAVRAGDRIVAIDDRTLPEPMLVKSSLVAVRPAVPGSPLGVLLHNPTGSDVEHWLYPDSHVIKNVVIDRPAPTRPQVVAEPHLSAPAPLTSSAAPEPVVPDLHAPAAPVPADIADRLRALSTAVFSGASNPRLIKRANRIADDLAPAHPDLAERLRTVLTKRWESLGNRVDKIDAILAEMSARPAYAGPDPEPAVTAKRSGPVRRTRFGLTLEGGGDSWSTPDERWVLTHDEFPTQCENPHPMRVTQALATRVRQEMADSGNYLPRVEAIFGAEAVRAVRAGKRGYLCPGGEEHTYQMWSVMGGHANPVSDPFLGARFETLDEAWSALAGVIGDGS